MTKAQRSMLELAADAPRRGWDGVCARRQTVRTAESLTRAGLLRFAGWGMDVDDGGEARIYEITDAGRAALGTGTGGTT